MTATILFVGAVLVAAFLAYKFGSVVSQTLLATFADRRPGIGARPNAAQKARLGKIEGTFFHTVFILLGYIAKSDGKVNQVEVNLAETYMEKMGLSPERRREAIDLFKIGAKPAFDFNETLADFHLFSRNNPNQTEILLIYLIGLARKDGLLVGPEVEIIQRVAKGLGFSSIAFDYLLRMISAQFDYSDYAAGRRHDPNADKARPGESEEQKEERQFEQAKTDHREREEQEGQKEQEKEDHEKRRKHAFHQASDDGLTMAFHALGLTASASDADVKKAYRRLANQFHPDKLASRGLPDFMVAAMEENFKQIVAAYKHIKKFRPGLK
jgi:DnaJ like chaperone protein